MSKKIKVIVSILLAAILLTAGTTITVLAEDTEEETTPPKETSKNIVLDRVAEILNIDKEDLVDAFNQACQEMKEAAFINLLEQAVTAEIITQEQADEILEWWEQRPNDALREWCGERFKMLKRNTFNHMLRFGNSEKNGFGLQKSFGNKFCPNFPLLND
ncbi:MAG: hypothetical protein PHQ86_08095 [Dehalococcoidales bacterium]|nr:hypothetical protein [Dehalococcoidales bacterium]